MAEGGAKLKLGWAASEWARGGFKENLKTRLSAGNSPHCMCVACRSLRVCHCTACLHTHHAHTVVALLVLANNPPREYVSEEHSSGR